MKKHLSTLILILVMVAGLSLLLYPTVSNYWNSFRQSRVVASYTRSVSKLDQTDYANIRQEAQHYNAWLLQKSNRLYMTDAEKQRYNTLLNTAGNGVMGTIEIPSINIQLPIYHGTDEAVLQVAVGHVEGTSLPLGGPDTHSVLSGHRGLPSAQLFTHLDKLAIGDRFMLRVLDEVLTYEVDQILTVDPNDVDALQIIDGADLCTLVTCTPYGINTHRLLVRGHRVETELLPEATPIESNARSISKPIVFTVLSSAMMLIWMLGSVLHFKKR